MTQAPPGWHPDPGGGAQWRYWDGQAWTDHTSPYRAVPATPRKRIGTGVVVAIVLGGLAVLGGCGTLIGVAVNRGIHEARKESNRYAITDREFRSVGYERQAAVEQRLGIPARRDHDNGWDCIYYNREGHPFSSRYQLCFSPRTGLTVYRGD